MHESLSLVVSSNVPLASRLTEDGSALSLFVGHTPLMLKLCGSPWHQKSHTNIYCLEVPLSLSSIFGVFLAVAGCVSCFIRLVPTESPSSGNLEGSGLAPPAGGLKRLVDSCPFLRFGGVHYGAQSLDSLGTRSREGGPL